LTDISPYGIDEALAHYAAQLATSVSPTWTNPELDRLIQVLGPFPVGHFLVRSSDEAAVAALREYLHTHWRAWSNFIEQMIAAARRDKDENFFRFAEEFGSD
jgi:hypothetical protein